MLGQRGEISIFAEPLMGLVRKILIFMVITGAIILVGRALPKWFPGLSFGLRGVQHPGLTDDMPAHPDVPGVKPASPAAREPEPTSPSAPGAAGRNGSGELGSDSLRESTNSLPVLAEDTTGGKWEQKLFGPLRSNFELADKSIRRRKGYWEAVFPKGKPIHEYALEIETLCRRNEITVEQGAELRPANRSIEYLLMSNGQHIKLRASLGKAFMAGSARLAIVITELDSIEETQLAEMESAAWAKTLVANPYSRNGVLRKLRYAGPRTDVLIALPMEPSNYPYLDPGKHALFIHHNRDDVGRILSDALDSLPKASGFASRFGDRAIENGPLLDKLFQYTAGKKLLFLDLTASPRSLSRQSSAAQGAYCRAGLPWREEGKIGDELARRAGMAEKTGEGIFVLPYTPSGFRLLEKALAADADRFADMGLELVTLSNLVATPPDTALSQPPKLAPPPSLKAPPGHSSAKGTAHAKDLGVAHNPLHADPKSAVKSVPKSPVKSAPKSVVKPASKSVKAQNTHPKKTEGKSNHPVKKSSADSAR